MRVPETLVAISVDVKQGKVRSAKVRSLLGYYGLKRRSENGVETIRRGLAALGIETDPDFATVGMDDRVRFCARGGASGAGQRDELGDESSGDFVLETESDSLGAPRFRIVFRAYDAFERLRSRLVAERLAKVLYAGQNARRDDRNSFPFHISVQLPEGISLEELEAWTSEAVSLAGPTCGDEPETETVEPTDELAGPSAVALWERLSDHTTALHEDLRSALLDQMRDLEAGITHKVDEIRFESVRSLATELNTDEAMRILQEFEAETHAKLKCRDDEVADYVEQIGFLEGRLRELEEQTLSQEYDPSDAYPTMVNTVQLFQDLCVGSPVIVHENAVRAAARSGSVRRRDVLRLLLALKELAEELYVRGPVRKPLKDWFRPRGYEYAIGDSVGTAGRYGKEREVRIDDKVVRLEEHVTLFPNSTNCVQVYFFRDDASSRLVVGYVGPHLNTISR